MTALPRLPAHDWNKVCYAIIVEHPQANPCEHKYNLSVVGCGLTPEEAKTAAVNNYTAVFDYSPSTKNAVIQSILDCGLDTGVKRSNVLNNSLIVMRYCEAKLYIYAKDRGYERLVCYYDGAYAGHLARYLKYRVDRYDSHEQRREHRGNDPRSRACNPRIGPQKGRRWGPYGDSVIRESVGGDGCGSESDSHQ